MSKKKKDWKTEKDRVLNMSLEERRKEYRRSEYVPLDQINTWKQSQSTEVTEEEEGKDLLRDKVSLYKGDITILEVDAIVNAANSSLLGGGGVDGCIHKAAGSCLYEECNTLNGCDTGNAKITCGYDLPAKYVIHTVGPVARGHVGEKETNDLTACYQNSLELVKGFGLRSVAFPCISTGIYGFPNEPAANIALETVKSWVKENHDKIERVIFCVFLEADYRIYKEKIPQVFQDELDPSKEDTDNQPAMEEANTVKHSNRQVLPDASEDKKEPDPTTDSNSQVLPDASEDKKEPDPTTGEAEEKKTEEKREKKEKLEAATENKTSKDTVPSALDHMDDRMEVDEPEEKDTEKEKEKEMKEKAKEKEKEKEMEKEKEKKKEMEKEMEMEMEKEKKDKEMEKKKKKKEMEKEKKKEMEKKDKEMEMDTEKEKEKKEMERKDKDLEKEKEKEMQKEMEMEIDMDMEKEEDTSDSERSDPTKTDSTPSKDPVDKKE